MKFARTCCTIVALAALSSCSSGDAEESRPSATDASPAQPQTDENADPTNAVASGDGNASITLGDQEYRFTTSNCSFDDIGGDDVSGVVTIAGEPTFVEFGVLDDSTGLISMTVGVGEDIPTTETLEESLERGLQQVWNLFYEADDLTEISDTKIRGSGEFLLVLTIGEGSSGDTLPGAFEADCS